MQKKITIGIFVILVLGVIYWYYNKSREGFQTRDAPVTSVLNSPDESTGNVCAIMINIYEQLKAKYIETTENNNPYLADVISESLKSSEAELKKMGCKMENT
jgi:hypothetical protein